MDLVGFIMVRIALLLGFAATLCLPQFCCAQTPHALLWDGTPQDAINALAIMKEAPTWVTRKDSDSQTPLHVAARFGHVDVVKWLLAYGADVDARAYNKFTPLHLTKNAEIVKLILAKKPDLTLKSGSGTALQKAMKDLRHYNDILDLKPDLKRDTDALRQIVNMYVEHLGDDIDLVSAVRLGQLDKVREIIDIDPASAHGGKDGPNPLGEAAKWGQLAICKFLVEKHKVDVDDFKGGHGYPIIKGTLKYPEIVNYLIEQGADLKTRITWRGGRTGVWIIGDNATALHFAASDGVPETIKILLNAGVDAFATTEDVFDRRKEDTQTALEVAAYFGKTDNAVTILEHPKFKDADVKVRQQALDRSLITGSYSSPYAFDAEDRAELIEALLKHGANLNATNNKYTTIQSAVTSLAIAEDEEGESVKKVIAVLRKHGAQLDAYSAVALADLKTLKKLLEADPKAANTYSADGYPALHKAIDMNYAKAVKVLIDAGGDIEIKNKSESTGWNGETPLHCAAFGEEGEILKMLINAGADVNATAEKQITPLHDAVRSGNVGVAKLLLQSGANKEAKDHEGKTPLEWASNEASAQEFAKLFSEFENRNTAE